MGFNYSKLLSNYKEIAYFYPPSPSDLSGKKDLSRKNFQKSLGKITFFFLLNYSNTQKQILKHKKQFPSRYILDIYNRYILNIKITIKEKLPS